MQSRGARGSSSVEGRVQLAADGFSSRPGHIHDFLIPKNVGEVIGMAVRMTGHILLPVVRIFTDIPDQNQSSFWGEVLERCLEHFSANMLDDEIDALWVLA